MNRLRLLVAACACLGAASLPTSASAASPPNWRCTAAPIAGSLLGQPLPTPTAGSATGECVNDSTIPTLEVPGLLKLNALNGVTAANKDGVFAGAGLADASIGSLPIPIPAIPIPDDLKKIVIPGPLGVPLATVDLTPAINAIQSLPSRNLLGAQALYSNVTGRCQDGKPVVSGASRVLGAQVLGLDVDPNKAIDTSVNLVDTTNIALSSLDLTKVSVLNGTLSTEALAPLLKPILAGRSISIPAQLAQVKLTPSSQTTENGLLVQRALRAQISLAGRSIADLTIGQAAVGAGAINCAPVVENSTEAALQCTKRKLVLIDVLERRHHVTLLGAADKSLVGKTVRIRFKATGKTVARVKVRKDGSFSTTAHLPRKKIRHTNKARYQAFSGKEKSLNLKLHRRMVVDKLSSKGGKVTIKGRVIRPLARHIKKITLKRRVTCKKMEVVKRFKPRKSGRFSVTVKSPKNLAATVYRLQTQVRNNTHNPKLYPTFTLPRAVDL